MSSPQKKVLSPLAPTWWQKNSFLQCMNLFLQMIRLLTCILSPASTEESRIFTLLQLLKQNPWTHIWDLKSQHAATTNPWALYWFTIDNLTKLQLPTRDQPSKPPHIPTQTLTKNADINQPTHIITVQLNLSKITLCAQLHNIWTNNLWHLNHLQY